MITEDKKPDSGLLIDLFSKNQNAARKLQIPPIEQEHRYSKRQRVEDDGPIDHDLMAALGFGKNRQRNNNVENDVKRTEHVTTIGDYLRSVTTFPPIPKEDNHVGALHSPISIERRPSSDPPKCVAPLHKSITTTPSPSAPASSKDNCRDVRFLQKRAYEAQIAREEAMTKYYQLKMKKLELEIEQLQQSKVKVENVNNNMSE
ncbi:unnamed protein product [Cylicostephanus goldi]|uniref:Uncharacterized protein n=1 Tax=Cylicostephanus goldi TaxID=71465 RepID=A0A3P6QWT8_CYLGO|nr:unnamed protein product [Cylicostephanus goldi]